MDSVAYLDFDLLIEREGEVYTAQVLNSPAGQASVTFSVPFSALELDNFLLRIGRPRRGTRRIDSPEVSAAKGFGGRLFDAVFNGEVRGCLRSSIDEANRQGRGLRVRLRLTDVPELAELPWEYLYNQPLNRFLALSDRTPLVRYLELPESIRPLTVSPPLRILVMISSPKNFDKLDVEREWENLKEALGDFEGRGLVELERLNEATPGALRRQLRRGQYHVFHFIGHGGFDQQIQDGVLVLEDREGQGRHVSGQDLGTLLYDHHPMRLAVLNACEGARGSRTDPFAGVAQSLLQQGVPAVIAMQFEITDEAAITFAHEFYGAVADNYPVDAALSQARQMIKTEGSGLEWGTPVLYMRAPDGRIFNVKHSSDEDGEQPDIAALYHDAQADIERGEGGLAVEKLRKLLGLAPGHTEASEQLSRALEQQELDTAYRSARELYEAGQWPEALECLNRLQKMRRGYKDVETLTANAESELAKVNKKEQEEKEIEDFYGEAKAAIRAEDWPTAITKLQAILRADRSHVEAAEKLNHAERQQKLSALYTTGRELYEARRLTEALDYLSEAEKIQSNYKDVAALIADAKGQSKRARIASFCQEAQALMNREDWAGAESKLQTLLNLHPGDPDALALLDRVRQGAQIKNFYAEGQSYLAAARWDDALSKFLEVHRLQHDYKNVAALIEEAQSKTTERQKAAQSAALEGEAQAEVGKRVADVEKLQALYGTEPDHPRAKAELRAAWQQQQLANLYAEGQRRLAANDLSGALVLFRRVREVLPDYKDVSALIAYIESRSEPPPQSQPRATPLAAFHSQPSSGVPTKVKRGALAASGVLAIVAAALAFWPRGDEPSSRSATGNVSVADVSTPAPTEKESLPGTGTKSSGTPTASPKAGAEKSLAKATPTLAPKKAAPVAGGVLNGKAISKPVPSYPPVAKAAGVSGAVTVQIMVDESGNVISATAVGGHPLLQEAARQAALQARFSPTLLSGQPVRVSGVITYNFVLPATTTKQ